MRRNPSHITYNHVIKTVEKQISWLEFKKDLLLRRGDNVQGYSFDIEVMKLLARLLKRHQRNTQLNLQDLFEQIKKSS